MNNKRLKATVLTLAGSVLIGLVALMPIQLGAFGWRDLLPYWCASHLLTLNGDPYDRGSLQWLERVVAPERETSDPAWNPPWLLVVLLPLALFPFEAAARIWLMLHMLALGLLPPVIWRMYSDRTHVLPPVWLAVLGPGFAASLAAIAIGQIVILVLLGLVLCVLGLKAGRDAWAGAALLLCVSKPHLTYLVAPMILIWAAVYRRWRVWLGLGAAAVIGLGLVTVLSPGWLNSYLNTLGNNDFFIRLSATIGGFVRAYWGTDALRWLGVITLALLPWLVRLIDRRGMFTAINPALFISLPFAPYCWSFDQIVLLPAIVQIAFWLSDPAFAHRSRKWFILALIAIYIAGLGLKLSAAGDMLFVCMPIALGCLYVAVYHASYSSKHTWAGRAAQSVM